MQGKLAHIVRLLVPGLVVPAAIALASGSAPMPAAPRPASAVPTAESVYNQGLTVKAANKWLEAEADFRQATTLKPDFPEAWSELGHALRKRGHYDESVEAYQQALRLRPDFPEAMEYLGETYVLMGKHEDAQQLLERLRTLDATQAAQLEKALGGGRSGY
jgi:Flp pilus assembly protein TadD